MPPSTATTSDRTRRAVGATLLLCAYAAVATAIAVRTVARLHGRELAGGDEAWGLHDFNGTIYYPVLALLDGRNPYDAATFLRTYPARNPFPLYLPATLALHLPFGLLPQTAAEIAYFLAIVALVPCYAALVLRLAGIRAAGALVFGVATLMLLSRPGSWNLFLGQCTVTVAIGVVVALLFARARPLLAAAGLAVAMLKPTFGVPVAALLLARGDRAAVVGGVGLAGAVSAAVAAVLARAAGGVMPFLASLVHNQSGFGTQGDVNPVKSMYRIDASSLVARILQHPLGGVGEVVLLVVVLGVGAAAVRRLTTEPDASGAARLSATLVVVTTLVCTYHQTYDALLLAIPLVMLAQGRWAPADIETPRRRALVAVLLAIPAGNYLATSGVVARLGLTGGALVAVTTLNGAAILTAFVVLVVAAFRSDRRAEPAVSV